MPKFNKIPALETKFELTKKASSGIYFDTCTADYSGATGLKPKKGKDGKTYDSFYFKKEYNKKKIVLHSTVGFLTGDLPTLTKENVHCSVNYLIARNGIVYEIFKPKYWSYNLGKGSVGGNGKSSKESISIELSNIGPLHLDGTDLKNVYGSKYCKLTDVDAYVKYSTGFRGYKYFATFTEIQYTQLKLLLEYLTEEFDIPYEFVPEKTRVKTFATNAIANAFTGICSHVNFRKTGKCDIGPDFLWDKIMNDEDEDELEPEEENKFIFEDDTVEKNILSDDYGKETQTATDKITEVNNSNSSHFCTNKIGEAEAEEYESGQLGKEILNNLESIDWLSIDYQDSELMRKTIMESIATGFYNFITNTAHFNYTSTTTGSYVLGNSTVAIVAMPIQMNDLEFPELDDLKNKMNKYYSSLNEFFSVILIDWLDSLILSPLEDIAKITFIKSGLPPITGDFKFKCNQSLIDSTVKLCEADLKLLKPTKFYETWTIVQKWLFTALSNSLVGQNMTTSIWNLTPGPSLGGANTGYCLGTTTNVYTSTASTCLLTFNNPDTTEE